ncbi:MAG: hypothetical protein KAH12_01535 [Anaerolineales bacterium]|nr:hypothetical protein [Anaerolineales bacterium]
MNPKTRKIIRWIARIWAALMLAFMLFMFIAHIVEDGIGPEFSLTLRESLMMVSMFVSLAGLALAWKWERLGGILTVGGMAAFYLFDLAFSGTFPRTPTFFIVAFPGVLFLIYFYSKKKIDSA